MTRKVPVDALHLLYNVRERMDGRERVLLDICAEVSCTLLDFLVLDDLILKRLPKTVCCCHSVRQASLPTGPGDKHKVELFSLCHLIRAELE